ncbi:MAG: ABC transporter permease [Patescibacteria group bacterium]
MISRFLSLLSFSIRDTAKSWVVLILVIASLSVAFTAIFISNSILSGFQHMFANGEIGWIGHIVIHPEEGSSSLDNVKEVTSALDEIEEIESYAVRSSGNFGVLYKDKISNPYASIGIDIDQEKDTTHLSENIIEGKFIKPSDSGKVVIGKMLADDLRKNTYDGELIEVGEEITVSTISGKQKKYTIAGIIDAKTFIPNWLLIMSGDELEQLDYVHKNSAIVVKIKDYKKNFATQIKEKIQDRDFSFNFTTSQERAKAVKEKIKAKGLNVEVYTWREISGYVDDIMATISFITGLIINLLIVSVFVIVGTMIFINVFQKKRQIGILKSMGASNTFVVCVYILEAFLYFLFSFVIGLFISFLIHQYSIGHPISLLIGDFHTVFNWSIVIDSFILLFIAAVGGSFIPAFLASRIKIVDVIRSNG